MMRRLIFLLITLLITTPIIADPPGSSFLYQGYLKQAGASAAGLHDFQFSVFDALSGGSQFGTTLTSNDVDVQQGLFNIELDFGNDIFTNKALWLEISVRPDGGGGYTVLSPRQPLRLFALNGKSAPLQTSLSGLVTVPPGTTAVTGVGTQFTLEISVGDPILIDNELHTVASIDSDSQLSLETMHETGALAVTAITDGPLFRIQAGNDKDKLVVGREGVKVGNNGSTISRIEHGTIGDCSGSTGTSATYDFSTPFISPPRIFLTPETSDGLCTTAAVDSITQQGFTWRAYKGDTPEGCTCIHWIAIGL